MMIMAFGIPGDAVTAVMMGALTIHGIQPGPLFISQHPKIAYGIYAAYLVALPLMIAVVWIGSRAWLRIILMPKSMLCLLYTSDAADERSSVDLGGRRII